jgi:hypothetical protein
MAPSGQNEQREDRISSQIAETCRIPSLRCKLCLGAGWQSTTPPQNTIQSSTAFDEF